MPVSVLRFGEGKKTAVFYKKTPTEFVVGSSGSRLPSKVTTSQQKKFISDNRGLV